MATAVVIQYCRVFLQGANHRPPPVGLLPDMQNCGLRMHRDYRERFPRHRGLAIPACITARAWPLSDKKHIGFLSDSGHVRAVMHVGIGTWRFPFKSVMGKTRPVFPVYAQPAILRIW